MTGLPSPSTIPAKTRPWLEKKPSVFTLMASQIQANNLYHRRHFLVTLSNADYPFGTRTSLSISAAKPRTKPKLKPQKLSICSSLLSSSSSVSDKNPPDACEETNGADARTSDSQSIQKEKRMKKKRVFFLDVNALCYQGNTRSLHSFAHWIFLFFSQVSLSDPVIAVISISFSVSLCFLMKINSICMN